MKKLPYILAMLAALCLSSLAAQAQADANQGAHTPAKDTAKTHAAHHAATITGCLAKGDEPGEYTITGEDGKTHEVRSRAVKLEPHVGHTVTITAVWAREGASEEAREAKEKGEAKEGEKKEEQERHEGGERYLRATSLKMVSDTCKK